MNDRQHPWTGLRELNRAMDMGAAGPSTAAAVTAAGGAAPRVAGTAIANDGIKPGGAANSNSNGNSVGNNIGAAGPKAGSPVSSSKPKQRRVTQACD